MRVRKAVLATAGLLRELGHDAIEQDPKLLDPTTQLALAPRYLSSAAEAVAALDLSSQIEQARPWADLRPS
jgi:amidase